MATMFRRRKPEPPREHVSWAEAFLVSFIIGWWILGIAAAKSVWLSIAALFFPPYALVLGLKYVFNIP